MLNESNPLAGLPERFDYIRSAVECCTPEVRLSNDDLDAWVECLTPAQLETLESVYREIDRRSDMWDLSAWINSFGVKLPREWNLFCTFSALARKNVQPFVSREVEFTLPPRRVDWSGLPPAMEYLRAPAVKYAEYWSYDARERLLQEMTAEDWSELKDLAVRMRREGELERIWEWRQEHRGEVSEELVTYLVDLIQHIVPQ